MPTRVAVLVIGPTPPPFHGVAMATQCLLRGHDSRLALVHLDIADRRGIEHVDKPDLHDVYLFCRQFLKLAWLLASRRPRVVYLSISQATVGVIRDGLFVGLAKLFGARVVIHLHGGNLPAWFAERGPPLRAFVRWILRSCTKFIVLGETFREPLTALVAADKIVVVPNGVPPQPLGTPRAPRQDSPCRLLFLSTLSCAKGVMLLLESMTEAQRRGTTVELVLAGPWLHQHERAAAMRFVAEHALGNVVRFTGPVEGAAKEELYRRTDVFVFPGIQQEGQPLVVIEAMAAGVPVLFTDRGCLAETVVDGECGLMVKVGDRADLARKIAWLSERPEERQRMGENARRRYATHFHESQFVANMTAVLLDASANGQHKARAGIRQEMTRDYFNRVAVQFHDNYVERDSFKERWCVWQRLIHESLPQLGSGALCMDMGCGDGRLGQTAAAAGIKTVGIDQSGEMLALARERARRERLDAHTEYLQAEMPLPADLLARYRGRAGLILCSSVLEYIDSYEDVLRQFLELLSDSGRLIVSVPNGRSLYRSGERLLSRMRPDRNSYLEYQRHVFDPEGFRECAQRLGYTAVHEEYFSLPFRAVTVGLLARQGQRHLATLYLLVAEKPRSAGSPHQGLARSP